MHFEVGGGVKLLHPEIPGIRAAWSLDPGRTLSFSDHNLIGYLLLMDGRLLDALLELYLRALE